MLSKSRPYESTKCSKRSAASSRSPVVPRSRIPLRPNLSSSSRPYSRARSPSANSGKIAAIAPTLTTCRPCQNEPKSSQFVGEMRDAAQFYTNRVIKEYKDKDCKHVEWGNSYIDLLSTGVCQIPPHNGVHLEQQRRRS
ncbi:MAG: adenylate cyclase associated N terminal-domain-containing protein [Olpidium bornovanus]|uniref:Adenylate cyclase associated N terminal-domain-containing protein n=1 Tax=Olpidium bornovanus TaxID=278681 RepID=A0A8H8DJM8_9FUNG|nr:MAG: adenylate cyclase associated N terminal-domain-containing protein [Olpidium bornovanus]